jgi:hypothetical protein
MSGMEMLLVNTLKAFMPKEAAEKIYRMVEDGTFDRIGAVPADIAEIKRAIGQLHLGLATLAAHHFRCVECGVPARNPLHAVAADPGPVEAASAEHRSGDDADGGSSGVAGCEPDGGYGGSLAAVGGA